MAQRIRYIGNIDVAAEGKFLLEILTQLKNFGVGRVVTKNEWIRKFPKQPSYLIIKRVLPEMDRWLWRGKVWAEWTYRGKPLGVFEFEKELDRSDWKLIHKHQQEKFNKCRIPPLEEMRLPSQLPLSPLLRHQWMKETGSSDMANVPTIRAVHAWDKELRMVQSLLKEDSTLNPPNNGSVYDIHPKLYLDMYGEELPLKIDDWADQNR